jgi:hypothetical protein
MLTTKNYKNIIESLQKKPEHSAISSLEIKPIIEDNSVSSEVIQNEPLSISIKDVNTHTDTRNSALFYPQKENALFWCIYIANYGESEFYRIGNRYQNRELDEKQKIIQYIKNNPKKIKESNHKVTNIMVQELMSSLMIQKVASLHDCIVYSIFCHKISTSNHFNLIFESISIQYTFISF